MFLCINLITLDLDNTVCKINHEKFSGNYFFVTKNITDDQLIILYIDTADVPADYCIVTFFVCRCKTHTYTSFTCSAASEDAKLRRRFPF